MAENVAGKQRRRGLGRPFQPGQSGNPAGKPKGTRHRVTMLAELLLDREAETLLRKAIELALGGDTVALRLCLERIMAPRRDRPVQFRLPELVSACDATKAVAAISVAVARGELTPGEAAELSRLIEAYVKVLEATELDQRLRALEERQFVRRNHAP